MKNIYSFCCSFLRHPLQNREFHPTTAYKVPSEGLAPAGPSEQGQCNGSTSALKNFMQRNGYVTVPLSMDEEIFSFNEVEAEAQIQQRIDEAEPEEPPGKKRKQASRSSARIAAHEVPSKGSEPKPKPVGRSKLLRLKSIFYYRGPHSDQFSCVDERQINEALEKEGLFYHADALFDTYRSQYSFDHLKINQPPEFMQDVHKLLREYIPDGIDVQPEPTMTLKHMKRMVVLMSRLGARKQGFHIDSIEKGLVAMVSADGQPFKLGVCPGSHRIVQRIIELRENWLNMKKCSSNENGICFEVSDILQCVEVSLITLIRLSDYCSFQSIFEQFCISVLEREQWPKLKIIELTVPANHILYFSTRLLHCGWKFDSESGSGSNSLRYHYLFLENGVKHEPDDTVYMHHRPYQQDEREDNRKYYLYPLLRYFNDRQT